MIRGLRGLGAPHVSYTHRWQMGYFILGFISRNPTDLKLRSYLFFNRNTIVTFANTEITADKGSPKGGT